MSFENKLKKWTDEECLEKLYLFLMSRVSVFNKLIQNDDGLFDKQVIIFQAGDKFFSSPPQALDWPLQPLPMPEAMRKKAN